MIVDAVLDYIQAMLMALINLIPDWAAPSWVTGIWPPIGTLAARVGMVSAWIPWPVIVVCLTAVWVVKSGSSIVQLFIKLYAMVRGGAS